jgi:hypothetical protein
MKKYKNVSNLYYINLTKKYVSIYKFYYKIIQIIRN